MTGATTTPMPKMAMAMPCFSRGKLSTRMACDTGCSAPPPRPCSTRKKISSAQRRRQAAQKRADGEQRHADHVEPLAPEQHGEPAAHGQNDGVGDQVRGQHPGGFVDGGRKIAGDVRQRHVGHAGIEHLHEGGQHHRHGDDPRIDVGDWTPTWRRAPPSARRRAPGRRAPGCSGRARRSGCRWRAPARPAR